MKDKRGQDIVETNKTDALEKLYEEGKVYENVSSPEEDYMMVQATDKYMEFRKTAGKAAYIKHLAQETMKERPEPAFKRVDSPTKKDRLTALQEEVEKSLVSVITLPEAAGEVTYYRGIPIVPEKSAPLRNQISFRYLLVSKNRRLGRLKWYEKVYAYLSIAYKSWRQNG